MSKNKGLTVGQLIDLLKKQDQDAAVTLEGCDCAMDCTGVSTGTDASAYKGHVVLRVNEGVFSWKIAQGDLN